jgi:hypothetical protein
LFAQRDATRAAPMESNRIAHFDLSVMLRTALALEIYGGAARAARRCQYEDSSHFPRGLHESLSRPFRAMTKRQSVIPPNRW